MVAQAGERAEKAGTFHCARCGEKVRVDEGERIPRCPNCDATAFDERTDEAG